MAKKKLNIKIEKRNTKRSFRIRDRFSFTKTYKVIKKSLIDTFLKETTSNKNVLTNLFLGVFGILVFIFFIYFILSFFSKPPIPSHIEPTKTLFFSSNLMDSDLVTAGSLGNISYSLYAIYNITLINQTNATATIFVYDNAPKEIYILKTPYTDMNYNNILSLLVPMLRDKGFVVEEVAFGDVETLPAGALLLVPSGLMYYKFFEPGPGNLTSLLNRGVNILYVGNDFSVVLNDKGEKISLEKSKLKSLPFSFISSQVSIKNLSIKTGLYKVEPSRMIYEGISVYEGKGKMIFVPKALNTFVWKQDPKNAANDITKIIYDMYWLNQVSNKTFELHNGTNFIYSPPFKNPSVSAVIKFNIYNKNYSIDKIDSFLLTKQYPGDLYVENGIEHPSFKMSGQEVTLIFDFKNISKTSEYIYLRVYKNRDKILSLPVRNKPVLLMGHDLTYDFTPDLKSGIYLLTAEDKNNTIYSKSLFLISNISFVPTKIDFIKNHFEFLVYTDSKPTPIYQKVSVILDDDPRTEKDFAGIKNITLDYPHLFLKDGDHTFKFKIRDEVVSVVLTKRSRKTIFSNPIAWILIFLVAALVGVTSYIATHREKLYYLDIPEFPPIESTRTVLKVSRVLKLFEEINKDYKWKNTPLKFSEIKKGFSKIIYNSKPVFISDYNLSLILEELEKKGYIKSFLGYYGLTKWEDKYSIPYLAMFRKVRDICISRIVPFTNLGKEKFADVKLTLDLQNIYLHFAEDKNAFERASLRALKTISKGLTIILFPDEATKKEYLEMLNSLDINLIILKLFIIAGLILPLTVDELDKRLKELRGL